MWIPEGIVTTGNWWVVTKHLEEVFDKVQLLLEEILVIDDETKRNERLVRVGS